MDPMGKIFWGDHFENTYESLPQKACFEITWMRHKVQLLQRFQGHHLDRLILNDYA